MGANCKHYDFNSIEQFWQDYWDVNGVFLAKEDSSKEKFYILDMFPYPSGAGLHIGHPEGYTASDILGRYKRACGYNVLHPMGWDAFGLPAEQHAIQTGINPADNTERNIAVFKRQIKRIGFAIDWSREINTTDPKYFKWTQWIFLQLFKHGLAFVDERPVWWCENLKAVLANEEVINGRSERGNFPVQRKNLRQWVLRITQYADKLIEGLEDIDWPESTKRQQMAWIGKSKGAEIRFSIDGFDEEVTVYTTRPDTIFGATFLVLAPEHPLLKKIVAPSYCDDVKKYIEKSQSKSDLERTDLAKTKTGVPTGSYAVNPATGRKIEIWVADYVLMSYGSGAIMAVPAHDSRDYAFAKAYDIPIIQVISDCSGNNILPYTGDGILINSGEFSGLSVNDAKQKIIEKLHSAWKADHKTNYKLRDWLFSRQRYWGEPIPIVWVEECDYNKILSLENSVFKGLLPSKPVSYEKEGVRFCALPLVPEQLPLKLPSTNNYLPSSDGESPLANLPEWLNVKINIVDGNIVQSNIFAKSQYNGEWISGRRETNTMPQWAGSCWYYLRYLSPNCQHALVSEEAERYWGSPDFYIGGAEHAVLHLLYARFWHRFLYDIGIVHTKEPFSKLFHQGIILGEDGSKMSKSRGNVINPDDIIKEYGADALRMYEMFLGPLDMMKPWSERGIEGMARFLRKIWRAYIGDEGKLRNISLEATVDDERGMHDMIKKVTEDIESLKFNTAISHLMVGLGVMNKDNGINRMFAENFLKLLAPFAPHIAEELWSRLGHSGSIVDAGWPQYDDSKLVNNNVKIMIQVNGKLRSECMVDINCSEDAVRDIAIEDPVVQNFITGKNIVKTIYVPGKIFNIVTR